jgi:hypothetical protein
MARATARQSVLETAESRFVPRSWRDPEDSWPEEPTAVDSAMTMEELIVDELRRMNDLGKPANDPKKETPIP